MGEAKQGAARGGGRALAIVPARAGSTRLPGKNVRIMAGRPMLGWTLAAAQNAMSLDRIVVTTDDPEVAALARGAGVAVVDRPPQLAGPDTPMADAVLHALQVLGGDWDEVVLLQPTSPLRLAADIDGAVALRRARAAAAVIGVSSAAGSGKPESFHVGVADDGRLSPGASHVINGAVYVVTIEALRATCGFRPKGTLAWVMPPERGGDVDTLEEFKACETLLAGRV